MGSFNSTCSITDMSLVYGSPIYIQLILPTWRKDSYGIDGAHHGCGEKGLRVSDDGAFKTLPIGTKDFPEIEKQYKFIQNLNFLFKVLRPSYYGSQFSNQKLYDKFHEFSIKIRNKRK